MSYSKKLLGLVAATVAMMTASQMPVLSEESQYLLSSAIAQEENTEARKAEAESLLDQGIVLLNSSQFQEAIRVCEQALIIFRDLGELENEGVILNILGTGQWEVLYPVAGRQEKRT
ncbi:hypothetical protein [Phormidium sp. FACHB-1136]|uniref:hypothetical protein n=1 Tax=Phormidium sp. FACHB-1136 TaxID=2692848 RepID=UPI0016893BFF|nr:hypothetical protein [Phormidium sp. FACHB-1136]MBD2429179.1 hypothetical protein [Phormidium sp. FACHB-1136]